MPLSHGNLVVHGDVPRRSVAEADPDVRASETGDATVFHEQELPAPETTRNLLSMFRSLEDTSRAPPTPETTERHQAASRSGVHRAPSMGARHAEGGVQLDSPGGELVDYVPDAGEFENDPVYNADVVRESDRADHAEMPEQGTTRGLLARFQRAD